MVQHEILKFGDRNRSIAPVGKVSLTQQNMASETDVNNIMAKYLKTGLISHLNTRAPRYADFSELGDFHQNMILVAKAKESFMTLPSKIRDRFQNDPAKLLAFLANENNYDEAVKLGIVEPKPAPAEEPAGTPAGSGAPAPTPAPAGNTGAPAEPGA